ncbi:hypothetical protein AAVH_11882 [Aphelenchoides avenae]|nr:hypothetical protein AAVH_11882 [Aphelenchus avenae]
MADVIVFVAMVSDDIVVDSCAGTLEVDLTGAVLRVTDFAEDEVDIGSPFDVVSREAVTKRVKFVAGLLDEAVSERIPLTDDVDIVSWVVVTETLFVVVSGATVMSRVKGTAGLLVGMASACVLIAADVDIVSLMVVSETLPDAVTAGLVVAAFEVVVVDSSSIVASVSLNVVVSALVMLVKGMCVIAFETVLWLSVVGEVVAVAAVGAPDAVDFEGAVENVFVA